MNKVYIVYIEVGDYHTFDEVMSVWLNASDADKEIDRLKQQEKYKYDNIHYKAHDVQTEHLAINNITTCPDHWETFGN